MPKGLGTALKPAFEPVIVARKPLQGSVAANVLRWGTGALNVDGCRVGSGERPTGLKTDGSRSQRVGHEGWDRPWKHDDRADRVVGDGERTTTAGRWPPNVALDEEMATELDRQSGVLTSNPGTYRREVATGDRSSYRIDPQAGSVTSSGDSGGASRFFFIAREDNECTETQPEDSSNAATDADEKPRSTTQRTPELGASTTGAPTTSLPIESLTARFRYVAKADSAERPRVGRGTEAGVHNNRCAKCGRTDLSGTPCRCPEPQWIPRGGGEVISHPTVKPLRLMRWLVRLVTPPNGVILEPFAGSGATVEAARLEGFRIIAVEREADYLPLIDERIRRSDVLDFAAMAPPVEREPDNGRAGEASAERRYTDRGGSNFAMKPGRRRDVRPEPLQHDQLDFEEPA